MNGNRPRADVLLGEMGADPNPVWGRVWYHLNLGELDAAADWFETMIDRRDPFALVYANSPVTQRLHRHPRWARIARLMRLPVTVSDERG